MPAWPVCHLAIKKESTTQSVLKQIVGDRLKKRKDLERALDECRRCWTLDYPRQFHMDVLPAIPNLERRPTGILLTDTELRTWQRSNPIRYADWFYDRMKVIFREKRAALAESLRLSIEEVPQWRVKTPLQRVVQLLKRHRDLYFQEDQDDRPVSIIITTLAAQAYKNQADLQNALLGVAKGMPDFVEKRNGRWWVPNPVDPDENFADKWNEKPKRREKFFAWTEKVYEDFYGILRRGNIREAAEMLGPIMGRSAMIKAASRMGVRLAESVPTIAAASEHVPQLAGISHCLAPKWPMLVQYEANVMGAVYAPAGKRPKKVWDLGDRSVPKGADLKFTVNTNVPPPFAVQWQVVNTGEEAARIHQLRGDFYASDESAEGTRWESTKYAGTHWVEAFVLKKGVCVARSGRKYVRIRA